MHIFSSSIHSWSTINYTKCCFRRNLNLTREMQKEWISIEYYKYNFIIMAISDNLKKLR